MYFVKGFMNLVFFAFSSNIILAKKNKISPKF